VECAARYLCHIPEEYQAIAITLLRTAEAMRNQEEGRLECAGSDGHMLAYVRVHRRSEACTDEGLDDVPTIEQVVCTGKNRESIHPAY
jgi:hypothetical protein